MRAVALLFLPVLAAFACVGAVAIVSGSAGETQTFVWKKHAFTSKQQFEAWLARRNVSYADWVERHPGASPPWEDEGNGLRRVVFLAGALGILLALFYRARDGVAGLASGALLSVLARLRSEERLRPLAPAGTGFALRDAVSVYGLRAPPRAAPRQEPERPELVLVEEPPAEPIVAVESEVDAVALEPAQRAAVSTEPEPDLAVEAPPTRRRRPVRRVQEAAAPTTPRVASAPAAGEPVRLELDPEPEPAAVDLDPESGVVESPPRRRRRATVSPEAPTGADLDYIARNRAAWQRWAPEYESAGREAWEEKELHWGIWGVPESELRLLADLQPGDEVIDLGCGTGKVSGWLARRRIRPVAIDIAPAQLATAKLLQRESRLSFPLVCANAEDVPFEDATFDVAVSEYGASLWCDPRRWIPEACRLLRPGGRLVFITNGALLMACSPSDGSPAGERLVRDYFADDRVEFDEDGAVEFHLTHGEWIRLLGASGFVLENLVEVRPRPGAKAPFGFVTLEWAQRWPSEEIWVARKSR